MRRSITATTKCTQDFCKSDALAQTYQIKYDCFFLHGTENTKKLFSQELKVKTKVRASLFGFYIATEKFWKKNYSQVGAVERDFEAQNIPILGPNFRNLVN